MTRAELLAIIDRHDDPRRAACSDPVCLQTVALAGGYLAQLDRFEQAREYLVHGGAAATMHETSTGRARVGWRSYYE